MNDTMPASGGAHVLSPARLASTVLAVIALGMVSLFVHDLTLSHLGVPYPDEAPIPLVAGLRGGLLRRAASFCLVLLMVPDRIGQFAIESFWVKVGSVPLRFAATVLGLACPLVWGLLVAKARRP